MNMKAFRGNTSCNWIKFLLSLVGLEEHAIHQAMSKVIAIQLSLKNY